MTNAERDQDYDVVFMGGTLLPDYPLRGCTLLQQGREKRSEPRSLYRRYDPALGEKVQQLVSFGYTTASIAAQVGIPRQTVYSLMRSRTRRER